MFSHFFKLKLFNNLPLNSQDLNNNNNFATLPKTNSDTSHSSESDPNESQLTAHTQITSPASSLTSASASASTSPSSNKIGVCPVAHGKIKPSSHLNNAESHTPSVESSASLVTAPHPVPVPVPVPVSVSSPLDNLNLNINSVDMDGCTDEGCSLPTDSPIPITSNNLPHSSDPVIASPSSIKGFDSAPEAVNNNKFIHPVISSSNGSNAPPAVCPVAHGRKKENNNNNMNNNNNEPLDLGSSHHRRVLGGVDHPFFKVSKQDQLVDYDDILGETVPDSKIPAAGRGNSEDGKNWLNPSPNQLYRALARNDKPIEKKDAPAVAMVHNMVTDATWDEIMEYEARYKHVCPNPSLIRFQGMDGIYSKKATFMNKVFGVPLPFDRHDWFVDRCGKEVKYVIDYYSSEEMNPHSGQVETAYFIDARPEPNAAGLYDRAIMALSKIKKGERFY